MVIIEEIHKDDIGTKLSATIKEGTSVVNISTASVKSLTFRKPSTTLVTKAATFETDGSDGIVYYLTESGFLDEIGDWSWQALVTMSGSTFRSDIKKFKVYENLE